MVLNQNTDYRDFPGGPVIKNLPSDAGHMSSITGQGTNIPHATRQLSPQATTIEPVYVLELQNLCSAIKSLHTLPVKTQSSHNRKKMFLINRKNIMQITTFKAHSCSSDIII